MSILTWITEKELELKSDLKTEDTNFVGRKTWKFPWAVFRIAEPGIPDSKRKFPEFRIQLAKISLIPESRFPCMGRYLVKKNVFKNELGEIWNNVFEYS